MLTRIGDFIRELSDEWVEDGVLAHGAALAFYTFFSLAPLLVLAIAVAGFAFGRSAAQGEIVARSKTPWDPMRPTRSRTCSPRRVGPPRESRRPS